MKTVASNMNLMNSGHCLYYKFFFLLVLIKKKTNTKYDETTSSTTFEFSTIKWLLHSKIIGSFLADETLVSTIP